MSVLYTISLLKIDTKLPILRYLKIIMENPYLVVFFSAMLPILELRGALPLAILHYKIDFWLAYLITVAGNIVPVILILYLLDPVQKFLSKKNKIFHWFFQKLFARTRAKHSKRFETMEELALISFVAIPLPMTGGWTGALAAFVFGIKPKRAIPLIFLGVLIAGIIIGLLSEGVNLFV